jgi:hypothetical protein
LSEVILFPAVERENLPCSSEFDENEPSKDADSSSYCLPMLMWSLGAVPLGSMRLSVILKELWSVNCILLLVPLNYWKCDHPGRSGWNSFHLSCHFLIQLRR